MFIFILRRFGVAIPTLFVLITLSFTLMHKAPGGPFTTERKLPPQVLANMEARYNLDKPFITQYYIYLKNLLKGDLGPSTRYTDKSVTELIVQSLPRSAEIAFWSAFFIVGLGVAAGVWAALRQNQWQDYSVMSAAMSGIVFPNFVLAPLLILIFAIQLRWLPGGGWNDGSAKFLVLPVIAMATSYIAQVARITRGSMIEVLHSQFIRTAKAKGVPKHLIIWRHAFKPMLLPVISFLGPAFAGMLTGSFVIDTVFTTGGIGVHFVNAATNRDYSLMIGVTILFGALNILFNAFADIIYAWLDPRIRY